MPKESVQLLRVPINTTCLDCDAAIKFGAFAYFVEDTNDTLCIECGTKRGWSSKERVKQLIKELESKERLKAIKEQTRIELSTLMYYKKSINLFKLGENDITLENQIINLIKMANDYLLHVGNPEEKELFKKLQFEVRKTQEMQKQIREEIHSQIFLLEKEKVKRKRKLLFPDEDREAEQIEQEQSEEQAEASTE